MSDTALDIYASYAMTQQLLAHDILAAGLFISFSELPL